MTQDSRETRLYTIGHSNHPIERFLELLRAHGVRVLVDVRSQPYSKWAPQYRRESLTDSLRREGVDYVFLGRELGGRPEDRRYYDERGKVDYDLRSQAADFLAGVDRLIEIATTTATAILCAEENPERCHRRLLVTPAVDERGFRVRHVRGDGRVVDEAELGTGAQSLPFD